MHIYEFGQFKGENFYYKINSIFFDFGNNF